MAIGNVKQDVADIKLPYKLIPFMKYRFIGFIFRLLCLHYVFSQLQRKDLTGAWISQAVQ